LTTDEVRPKPHFVRLDHLSQSAVKGLYAKDITQYLKITKLTLQKYLEACIHPEGQFREFFKNFATFTTNYVVNEALSDDPQARHLQIARFFSGMRESPPQIFIQDNGYEYVPASLGSLTAGWNTRTEEGVQIVRIMDVVPVPVTITCATQSEQEIDDLIAFISAAFGQFQRFTCNYILSPSGSGQGVYWEVRIPLKHSISPKSHAALHNDPRDQLWQASCTMEVEFENSTYIQYNAAPRAQPGEGTMQVVLPDRIPLTRHVPFSIQKMQYPVKVYSSDERIAVIFSRGTSFTISPKRVGRFKVMIMKVGVGGNSNIPLIEKEVEVVVR